MAVESAEVMCCGKRCDVNGGGEGSDSFICDIFDKIIDFNSQEGDTNKYFFFVLY